MKTLLLYEVVGNPLILQVVMEKKRAFDDFRQNINAFIVEFKNHMREIVLFHLQYLENTIVSSISEK